MVGKARAIKGQAASAQQQQQYLLVLFVSRPLLDGRRPTYPVSAQLSISDLSIAPASAGDDEPDDMAAAGWQGPRGGVGLARCCCEGPTARASRKDAAVREEATRARAQERVSGRRESE